MASGISIEFMSGMDVFIWDTLITESSAAARSILHTDNGSLGSCC